MRKLEVEKIGHKMFFKIEIFDLGAIDRFIVCERYLRRGLYDER